MNFFRNEVCNYKNYKKIKYLAKPKLQLKGKQKRTLKNMNPNYKK